MTSRTREALADKLSYLRTGTGDDHGSVIIALAVGADGGGVADIFIVVGVAVATSNISSLKVCLLGALVPPCLTVLVKGILDLYHRIVKGVDVFKAHLVYGFSRFQT